MKGLILLITVSVFGCRQNKSQSLFNNLIDKTDIKIHLSDYGLTEVPKEIGKLKNAKRLYISQDSVTAWTFFTPNDSNEAVALSTPYKKLPDEITSLVNLKSLTLVGLELHTLPDRLSRLKNLDTLILFMNKLTIVDELDKLKGLKNLKYLGLLGNQFSSKDLEELEKSIPGIVTNPGLR